MLIVLAKLREELHQVLKIIVIAFGQLVEDVQDGRLPLLVVGNLSDFHELIVVAEGEQWLGKTPKVSFKHRCNNMSVSILVRNGSGNEVRIDCAFHPHQLALACGNATNEKAQCFTG